MKALWVLTLLVAVSVAAAGSAGAAGVAAARRQAEEVAAALADARAALARLEQEVAELERRRAATEARLGELGSALRAEAVRRYVEGDGLDVSPVFSADLTRGSRALMLAEVAVDRVDRVIEEYRAGRQELSRTSAELTARRDEAAAATVALERRRAQALDELARLQAADHQRRAREEAERREAARRSAEAAAASAAAARPAAAASSPASRSGPPRRSRPAPEPSSPEGGWVCPVEGPRAFTDDWGAARSGGRRHQGNDILSPHGTPVVAPVGGSVTHRGSRLGGLSFWLQGDDGDTYFGTHLSAYGQGGRVAAGTVIGYVGDTGNAAGIPHLHFEIHRGGATPVNPYPTLSAHC